ncbi:ABC transporter substrate-binding protein [Leucobacter japonicus]|uniref:ABC transporter substrate-binding protein n=1 Tax=Leucobacter japonicus TaxID=1461259 RepID=UPI0006A76BD2|nr:ABC transporter substrate-binding protein [Leucobacter japonicus]
MAFPTAPRTAPVLALAAAAGLALSLAACTVTANAPADNAGGSGDSESSGAPVATLEPPTIIKAGTLTICTGDSAPNIFYDENNELQGVEIDIANAMADKLGVSTTLGEYAFAGLIPALQAKQCDVIMGSLYIKPEREEIANFVPYLYSGTAVAVNKENPKKVTGFDDSLCGTKVVGITGATGAASAQEKSDECVADGKEPLAITLVDEGTNALQQVLAQQADAFIDTTEIVSYYEQQSDGDLVSVGEPFGKIRIGAATLKDNTDLNTALDDAFAAIVDDGTYTDILAKWGVESNDITQPE